MLLRHLHLGPATPYLHAQQLQTRLVTAFLAHKSSTSPSSSYSPSSSHPPPPAPTILTTEFLPTYTCGRREIPHLTPAQIAHLTASTPSGTAEFHPALRGGQTTFHGPGQLVAYPIVDLRRHRLGARDYVCLLEKAVIEICGRWGVEARRTGNPGVWVGDEDAGAGETGGERKICAVGVHLRRHIASHGIGLNVGTDLRWFERIVACGLEGKGTTSLEREGVKGVTVEGVGEELVRCVAERLEGVEGVVRIGEGEWEEAVGG